MKHSWIVPVRTYSLNRRLRWHWAKKHKQNTLETQMVEWTLGAMPNFRFPVTVVLTRIAPRRLDGDNLQGSLKAIRDAVARKLGVDDGDDGRVKWEYGQEAPVRTAGVKVSREYRVRIEISN